MGRHQVIVLVNAKNRVSAWIHAERTINKYCGMYPSEIDLPRLVKWKRIHWFMPDDRDSVADWIDDEYTERKDELKKLLEFVKDKEISNDLVDEINMMCSMTELQTYHVSFATTVFFSLVVESQEFDSDKGRTCKRCNGSGADPSDAPYDTLCSLKCTRCNGTGLLYRKRREVGYSTCGKLALEVFDETHPDFMFLYSVHD